MYLNKSNKVYYKEEEVAYWRKANHIHKWFVNNVQNGVDDCGTYPVTKEKLKALYDTVDEVMCNLELAPIKLPRAPGFFFGSQEYDEWYYEDLQYTAEVIDNILTHTDFDNEVIEYQSSW
jgi:hypothetical protein